MRRQARSDSPAKARGCVEVAHYPADHVVPPRRDRAGGLREPMQLQASLRISPATNCSDMPAQRFDLANERVAHRLGIAEDSLTILLHASSRLLDSLERCHMRSDLIDQPIQRRQVRLASRIGHPLSVRKRARNEGMRHASVHRVLLGPPARFVATCHRTGELKWFRVDNVLDSKLDTAEAFREVDSKLVDAYVRASLDGFNEGGPPSKHVFFVRDPSARWVARNLIEAMQFEEVPGGIRVTVETSAIQRLARFVVGLGDAAATPLTAPLELAVAELARGALASIAAKVPI
jgi:hypothetical protein